MGIKVITADRKPKFKRTVISDEEITAAAQAVRRKGGRLPNEVIETILRSHVEGLTPRRIQARVRMRHKRKLSEITLKKYLTEYAPRLREMISEWEKDAVTSGLARKSVRLNRLSIMAEALHDYALDDETLSDRNGAVKAITECRQIINQISIETGDQTTGMGDIMFINLTDDEIMKKMRQTIEKDPSLRVLLDRQANERSLPKHEDDRSNTVRTSDADDEGDRETQETQSPDVRRASQ